MFLVVFKQRLRGHPGGPVCALKAHRASSSVERKARFLKIPRRERVVRREVARIDDRMRLKFTTE